MRRFFSDLSVTATAQMITAIGMLGVQIYVARTVSNTEFGQYAAIQAYVLLVEAIFIARGGEVALQHIGRLWKADMARAVWYRDHLLRMDIGINIAIYLVTVACGLLVAEVFQFNWKWLALLALTIPAQIGYGVWKSTFIIDGKLKQLAYLEIYSSLALFILAVALTAMWGIEGLLIAMVLAAFVKTVITRWIAKSLWPIDVTATPPADVVASLPRRLRSANVHSIIRNAFMNGASQGDLLLISALRGPEATAIYKIAKTVAAIPIRAVSPAWIALRPRIISSVRSEDFTRLRKLLVWPAILLLGFGAVIAWPLFHFAETLVVLIFGETYRAATPAVLWLLLGVWVFSAISGWLNLACVLTTRKLMGSLIYFVWLAGVIVGGLLWGKESPTSMAMVAAGSMVLASLVGWTYFLRRDVWINKE